MFHKRSLAAPAIFCVLSGGKVVSKIFGLYPAIRRYREDDKKM